MTENKLNQQKPLWEDVKPLALKFTFHSHFPGQDMNEV